MKLFNAGLSKPFIKQCNSVVYHIHPNAYVFMQQRNGKETVQVEEFNDPEIVNFIYQDLKHRGIFIVKSDQSPEEYKEAYYNALKAYYYGEVMGMIRNSKAMMDDYKKKGVTLEVSKDLIRAERLKKELEHKLNVEAPIDDEMSFLDVETRQKLGISDETIRHVVSKFEGKFDAAKNGEPVEMELEKSTPVEKKSKRYPTAFEDLKLGA